MIAITTLDPRLWRREGGKEGGREGGEGIKLLTLASLRRQADPSIEDPERVESD
jgi:hypothetical protein